MGTAQCLPHYLSLPTRSRARDALTEGAQPNTKSHYRKLPLPQAGNYRRLDPCHRPIQRPAPDNKKPDG